MKCEAEVPQFSQSSCSDTLGLTMPGTGSVCLECGEGGRQEGYAPPEGQGSRGLELIISVQGNHWKTPSQEAAGIF